ncbi:mitochondrial import inner membrane translocase subunit Tim21 isoform X1 [Rhipicephalus sanguineus]|uniref:mitochondrial import inner membrane translocase subunit Tim21 isoform X1 n=2 Tax=Rhipicephalus sanguineus TaxID=34632 RepID=UPI0020C1FD0B|nr:mitochondrial import inner membrane translocase subunit Tim21 isoform X1 [Rhipicephalus sanguineus]
MMTLTSKVHVLVTGCKAKGFRNISSLAHRSVNGQIQTSEKDGALLRLAGLRPTILWLRPASTTTNKNTNALSEAKDTDGGQLTLGQKVKQSTKDASYLGVILAGLGVTGLMFYTIFHELFSGHSPNSVYSRALERCRADPRVKAALGEPLQGHGETTSRGRRRHVSHMEYIKDGINYMRMKFYIKGPSRSGTVHLEVREDSHKNYEYRYLFVDLDGHPKRTIILEDNRESRGSSNTFDVI